MCVHIDDLQGQGDEARFFDADFDGDGDGDGTGDAPRGRAGPCSPWLPCDARAR
jgi:hypothetical protein